MTTKDFIVSILISLGLFLILLSWPSYNYSFDSVAFMIHHNLSYQKDAIYFEHLHHPLKDIIGSLILFLFREMGYYGELITIYQLFISFISCITLALFYLLVRNYGYNLIDSLISTLFILCSYSYFYFSTQYEIYIPAILSQVLFFRAILSKNTIFIILTGMLLPLVHQTQLIILVVSIVSGMLYKEKYYQAIFISLLVYSLIITGIIFYVQENIRIKVLLGHLQASDSLYQISLINISNGIKSLGKIFIYNSNYQIITGLIVLLFIVWIYIYKEEVNRKLFRLIVVLYLVFLFIWDRGGSEIWVLLLPILAINLKSVIINRGIRYIIVTFIIIFGMINIKYGIIPDSIKANNKALLQSEAINKKIDSESLILLSGLNFDEYNIGKVYIPYFSKRKILILDWVIENNLWKEVLDRYEYLYIPEYIYSNMERYSSIIENRHFLSKSTIYKTLQRYKPIERVDCAGLILYKCKREYTAPLIRMVRSKCAENLLKNVSTNGEHYKRMYD
ncbi:MAG: hypothetical protein AB1765_11755 [Candidatus Hydrogenedentota bacterium]